MLDQSVKLVLGTLVLVAAARQTHADAQGDALDAAAPQVLVQLGVDAHILLRGEPSSVS